MGHPARIADQVLPNALDVLVGKQVKIVKDIEFKIRCIEETLDNQSLNGYALNVNQRIIAEMRTLEKKLKVIEQMRF